MTDAARERKSRRMMVGLMVGALVAYIAYKSVHLTVALEAWNGQAIVGDTSRAAK